MKQITTAFALIAMLALAGQSDAFWGCHGCYGSTGSYGSYGSYGRTYTVSYGSSGSYGSTGSYGSYGCSGCYGHYGLLARIHDRIAARRAARSCYGCYGCSGYTVSYGCSGCYGCSGSYGSSGSYGTYSTPTYIETTTSDCGCADNTPATKYESYASTTTGSGTLRVEVPADAKVYVNDYLTTSTGTERQFVSHGLEAGRSYSYDVRVEYERNGETVTESKQITLIAGGEELLAFSAPAAVETVATTLKLNVPAEAKVTLAGAATQQTGTEREFVTTKLAAGRDWSDYKIVVEANGQKQEKTITLHAGDVTSLDFHFGENALALRD
ncbi:TIGR03000 domain-containing protein [Aeoliella mucimassa]|uniref:Collagen triple helix repeat (20 copies) n=1 Tax=Aeoliella mucimassa TaxID=2527972 RepID=A0A518AM87_9BACT|nr:TIGR03000 domain-containing protein [Aeoliella mucimassa]QDU55837.1 Collagen triple helix repeat (20 copies) [Aeoliella mucimassa]